MTPHEELMALAGKATPGEWRQEHRRTATGGYSTEVFDEAGKAIATLAWHALPTRYEGEVGITSTDREANAAFIAAACNFVRSDAFRAMARDAEELARLRTAIASLPSRIETTELGDLDAEEMSLFDSGYNAALERAHATLAGGGA